MGTKSIESENVVRGRRINFLGYCFTKEMDILNVPITVVDFETNVKTKQGEGRYCVLFEQNGQRSKFITNCYNLKDVLDQAREAENNGQKIFPVENVIVKRRSLGDGKSAYYFEE